MKTKLSFLILLAIVLVSTASAQTIALAPGQPSVVALTAQAGSGPVSQTFSLTSSTGIASYVATISPGATWLTTSPTGNTSSPVKISADPTNLAVGSYAGTITITNQANSQNSLQVQVTFVVNSIGLNQQSITANYIQNSKVSPSLVALGITSNQAVTYTTSFNPVQSNVPWLILPTPTGTITPSSPVNVPLQIDVSQFAALAIGTYQDILTVTPSPGVPVSIPVTLVVSAAPTLTITPSTVNLAYQINGASQVGASQTLTISTNSTQPLSFSLTPVYTGSATNWLTISPISGTVSAGNNASVSVAYNYTAAPLSPNAYSASIQVSPTGGTTPFQATTINVGLTVSNNPVLTVAPGALSFTAQYNSGVASSTQQFTPQTSSGTPISLTVTPSTTTGGNWLTAAPNPATTGSPISITVVPGFLVPGTYQGSISLAPTAGSSVAIGNGPVTVPVTLTVTNDAILQTNVNALTFAYNGGTQVPAAQSVTVTSSNGAPLNYTVSSTQVTPLCNGAQWLGVSAPNSQTPSSFTVQIQSSGLGVATCTGMITVTPVNSTFNQAPIQVPVTMTITVGAVPVISPTVAEMTATQGSTQQAQATINVGSSQANSPISYTVQVNTNNGGSWLSTSLPSGGSTSANPAFFIFANPTPQPNSPLGPGLYTGTVTVTGGGVSLVTAVNFHVATGTLTLSSTPLSFVQTGGATPAAQTINISGGGQTLNYVATAYTGSNGPNWLLINGAAQFAGNTTANPTLSITVDGSKLTAGQQYTGSVIVNSPNAIGSPVSIPVTLIINSGAITASPAPSSGLSFSQIVQSSTSPATQTITLTSTPSTVSYTAIAATSTGGNWLTVFPASGSTAAGSNVVTVGVNNAVASTLAIGAYQGTVTITAPGASGSPLTYAVTLNVVQGLTINTSVPALAFSYITNSTVPATQTVQVSLTGPPGIGSIALTPYTVAVKTNGGGNWLSYTANSQTLPATFTVSANVTGLAAGNYTGTLTISTANAATPAVINVTLTVSTAPTPVITAIANAASYANGALSPGENIVVGGINFGPSTTVVASPTGGSFPTTLGNTTVSFDGAPAPMIYAASGQVSVMVPYGVAGRPTTAVTVTYLGVTSAPLIYTVAAAVPGIYTLNQQGSGTGAIVNQNYTVNGPGNPAPKGSVVSVYMTGEGATSPASTTGGVAPTNGSGLFNPALQPVTATVGGIPATVTYAGSAPGIIYGVMQVNVQIPANAASGALPIVISLGTGTSFATQSGVTVSVQ